MERGRSLLVEVVMITSFEAVLVERGAGGDVYRLLAASDAPEPSFYWYREGVLAGVTRLGVFLVVVAPGAGAAFEVLDDVNGVPEPGVAGLVELAWDGVAGAIGYEVRDIGDPEAPVVLGRVGGGSGRLVWRSPGLEAGAVVLGVVPVFERGQEGPLREVAVKVVKRPGPPGLVVSYDVETGALSGVIG